jgi:hypothetical protein
MLKHEIEQLRELLIQELYDSTQPSVAAVNRLCLLAYKGYGDLPERVASIMSDAPEYNHTAQICKLIAEQCTVEAQDKAQSDQTKYLLKQAALNLRRAARNFWSLQGRADKGLL